MTKKARSSKKKEKRLESQPGKRAGYRIGIALVVAIMAVAGAFWLRARFMVDPTLLARDSEGVRLIQEGKDAQAVAIWNSLIEQHPSYPDPYVQLAEFDNSFGYPDRALVFLQRLKKRGLWTPQAQVELAEAYVQLKDPRALKAAELAVRVAPDSSRAHTTLGTLY